MITSSLVDYGVWKRQAADRAIWNLKFWSFSSSPPSYPLKKIQESSNIISSTLIFLSFSLALSMETLLIISSNPSQKLLYKELANIIEKLSRHMTKASLDHFFLSNRKVFQHALENSLFISILLPILHQLYIVVDDIKSHASYNYMTDVENHTFFYSYEFLFSFASFFFKMYFYFVKLMLVFFFFLPDTFSTTMFWYCFPFFSLIPLC